MYTIDEISKLLDMSKHTIRYYTDMNLVPSLQRDKNGNRIFDEDSKNWLLGLKCLRGSGMSIKAIKDYVDLCLQGDSTLEERFNIILEQKKELEKQMKELNERYDYMEKKEQWYLDILSKRIPDSSNPETWNNLGTPSEDKNTNKN